MRHRARRFAAALKGKLSKLFGLVDVSSDLSWCRSQEVIGPGQRRLAEAIHHSVGQGETAIDFVDIAIVRRDDLPNGGCQVADAARCAFEEGACVLFGHSEEDVAGPYQLFAEALSHYVTHASEDLLLGQMGGQESELAGLVPSLATRIPGPPPSKATDSDSERYLMFASVVGLLARMSEEQPVRVVFPCPASPETARSLRLAPATIRFNASAIVVASTARPITRKSGSMPRRAGSGTGATTHSAQGSQITEKVSTGLRAGATQYGEMASQHLVATRGSTRSSALSIRRSR